MKIGVLYNCQNVGIADSLRALLPGAEVINYQIVVGMPAPQQRARAAELSACDHLVTTHIGPQHGKLALRALRETARNVHVLPSFTFSGYHPDTCYVDVDGAPLSNVTGGYQSRIAVAGYLAGLSPRQVEALYNKLVFTRLGYFGAFAEQSKLLIAQWAKDGIDAAPLLARWSASSCFTHSINHPKIGVLLDLARIACARMGIAMQDGVEPENLPDSLARGPMHPLFPDIAAALGIAPEGAFCAGIIDGKRETLSPAAFAARCFEDFSAVNPAFMLAAPGVKEAMSALGLSQIRRAVARRPPGPGMVLMTAHGTILRDGPGLTHLPLSVPASQMPYLRADGAAAGKRQTAGGLAGADMQRAPGRPAGVILSLAGKFLCAERDSQTASFSREAAGEWETFLLLHEDALGQLTTLLQSDWLVLETGETVPQRLIGLHMGPVLRFGRWRIDLARGFPRPAGGGHLTLILDGELCQLRQIAAPPAPALAGVPEPGKRLVLVGAPAWLPPPVTLRAADRDWIYRTAMTQAALNGRVQAADAVLRRDRDQPIGPPATGGPALPGLSIRFCPDDTRPLGWMRAAMRLHVLAAVAPAGIFLVPEGVPPDLVQAWQALGFPDATFRRLAHPGSVADDLLWLDNTDEATLPAEALAGLRARVGAPAAGVKKLFWRDGLAAGLETTLAAQGFEPVDAAALPLVAQIALVSQAAWVVGAAGRVPLAFCPAGARIVALTDAPSFDGSEWMIAAKLGLMYGVLRDPAHLTSMLHLLAKRL